jgi:hypothetical protein
MQRAWKRRGMYEGFYWESQKENLHVGGMIILK